MLSGDLVDLDVYRDDVAAVASVLKLFLVGLSLDGFFPGNKNTIFSGKLNHLKQCLFSFPMWTWTTMQGTVKQRMPCFYSVSKLPPQAAWIFIFIFLKKATPILLLAVDVPYTLSIMTHSVGWSIVSPLLYKSIPSWFAFLFSSASCQSHLFRHTSMTCSSERKQVIFKYLLCRA